MRSVRAQWPGQPGQPEAVAAGAVHSRVRCVDGHGVKSSANTHVGYNYKTPHFL